MNITKAIKTIESYEKPGEHFLEISRTIFSGIMPEGIISKCYVGEDIRAADANNAAFNIVYDTPIYEITIPYSFEKILARHTKSGILCNYPDLLLLFENHNDNKKVLSYLYGMKKYITTHWTEYDESVKMIQFNDGLANIINIYKTIMKEIAGVDFIMYDNGTLWFTQIDIELIIERARYFGFEPKIDEYIKGVFFKDGYMLYKGNGEFT